MNKTFRIAAMMSLVLAVILMSVGGTAWASPSQQGTVPGGVATEVGDNGGLLNTGTGTARVPGGAVPDGGNATADELSQDDLNDLGAPPAGQDFQGNGLDLQINNADGTPVLFFQAPVRICFPTLPGTVVVIRRWYTAAELQAMGRVTNVGGWIAFPSFASAGQTCILTRLPGNYAPVG